LPPPIYVVRTSDGRSVRRVEFGGPNHLDAGVRPQSNVVADDQRAEINRWLAAGKTVRLELQNGTEAYDVVPALSWSRADDGTPTVTEVEIADVRFD
jgi:hypothetical protein